MIDKIGSIIMKTTFVVFWCAVLHAFFKLFVLFTGVN